ncbi:MAG TPA: TraR/DksA family transcriptional regulator [Steroidobacteraceae bacterium]|nr:TraR/DksA family transcriptional regulator [Steroidobacteraceae bacterium]
MAQKTVQNTTRKARDLLLRRRAELLAEARGEKAELEEISGQAVRDIVELAAESEQLSALGARRSAHRAELQAIESALQRIRQGRYGICCECGAAIDPRRLAVAPDTLTCISCAQSRG